MSVRLVQDKINSYQCRSEQEEINAIKEITQEIALAGLARSGFFKIAAFQGGTCLRIFYGIERFSEDLDFVLQQVNRSFDFMPYLKNLKIELDAYGYQLHVQDKSKADLAVKTAFLKDDSLGHVLVLHHRRPSRVPITIKIKLEIDTDPPLGENVEQKYLDFPFPFSVTVQDLPSLFASKSHALLCRKYLKGRDWFDFVWYIGRKTPINFDLLKNALHQAGPWKNKDLTIDKSWYVAAMKKKIKSIDWNAARRDVERFLRPNQLEGLKVWSKDFFLDRLYKLNDYLNNN